MRQLFKNLASVHRAGLVILDIKPHNLVLTNTDVTGEREPRFKLIDLGACACFRTAITSPRRDNHGPQIAPPRSSSSRATTRRTFGSSSAPSRSPQVAPRGCSTSPTPSTCTAPASS